MNPTPPTAGCLASKCTINECCVTQRPHAPSPARIEEQETNIYFPSATFITFEKDSPPFKKNTDVSQYTDYSEYDNWSSPQSTPNYQTNNMFSNGKNYHKWGIAAFNTPSYNQA